jgi:hypothetical protein
MTDQRKPMILNYNWEPQITQQLLEYKSLTVDFVHGNFEKEELKDFLKFNLVDVKDGKIKKKSEFI